MSRDPFLLTGERLFAPGVGLVKDGPFTLVKIAKTVPKAVPAVAD